MTEPTKPVRRGSRRSVAVASRVAIGGLSLSAALGVVAVFAVADNDTAAKSAVTFDAGAVGEAQSTVVTAPAPTVTAEPPPVEPPPTTIVVITHYVTADGGESSAPRSSRTAGSGPAAPSGGPGAPAQVGPATPASPAAAVAAPAPAPARRTAPPVATTRAS